MQTQSTPASTANKFIWFIAVFAAFPLLLVVRTFAEHQRFLCFAVFVDAVLFIGLPFVTFLLLAERFDFFPTRGFLQHLACILLALCSSALCIYVSLIVALIVFRPSGSL